MTETSPTPPPAAAAAKARPDGVVLIAIWYAVLSGGAAFAACIATIPIGLLSLTEDVPGGGRLLASVVVGFGLTITVVICFSLGAIAWGLWNMRSWARIGALVVALLHIPFFPVGTAIGVGTLWYLGTHDEVLAAFRAG